MTIIRFIEPITPAHVVGRKVFCTAVNIVQKDGKMKLIEFLNCIKAGFGRRILI